MFFIKTANYLAPKISTVLHKLVRIGGFSLCWRVGNITPVPKYDSTNSCPSDYRPITITPVLSKVFERLLAKRLNNFAEKKNLFPHLQFGFRKGLGTCYALLTITNFVQKALDCGCEVRMVGLDFSAAFDRVNYKALIFKLRQLGIGGPFLSILTEFYQIDCRGLLLMVSLMIIEMLFRVYHRVVYLALCFSCCIPMICGLG